MNHVTSSDTKERIKVIGDIFNLTTYEATLYAAGLEFTEATLSDLAKRARIPRTTAYLPLQSLLRRGLFSTVKIKKRIHYRALEPHRLMNVFDQNRILLESIVHELAQSITAPKSGLAVQYFAGRNGILAASDIFLNESKGKLWRTFEHPASIASKTGTMRVDDYMRRRIARGIRGRMIVPASSVSPWLREHLARDKEELRETVVVSPKFYPIEASIAATDDMVQIINTEGEIFSILIKNPVIAKTLVAIHDMVWDRYTAK